MAGKRGIKTVRDMVLSMALICACAGGIYLFIPHDDKADPIKPVDYRVELATARRAAPYPVAAPEGLAEGWKPTSVTYKGAEGSAWHLGFLDPEREYVAVEQSTAPAEKYIEEITHGAADTGKTRQVAGQTWKQWEGPKYDALVRQENGATTVVTGTAPLERLAEMAAALKAS
ncbi:DUF4245 domain-containing protein [Streptomyces sp. PR69]|uniref:DUF4245 domain-containing protein n=1 Tax=Streptomyces sp. PR69 TaxID=2984950 RepID=UPI0022649F68|nr:DUF4245 domain-containing protein [Streptomyces sp. PR69]